MTHVSFNLRDEVSQEQIQKEFYGQLDIGLTRSYEVTFFVPLFLKDIVVRKTVQVDGPAVLRNSHARGLLESFVINNAKLNILSEQKSALPTAYSLHPKLLEAYVTTCTDQFGRNLVSKWDGECFQPIQNSHSSRVRFFGEDKYTIIYDNTHLESLTSAALLNEALTEAEQLGVDISTIKYCSINSGVVNEVLCAGVAIDTFNISHTPKMQRYKTIKEEIINKKMDGDVQEALGVNEGQQFFIKLTTTRTTGRAVWDGIIVANTMGEAITLAKRVAIYEAGFRGISSRVVFVMSKNKSTGGWSEERLYKKY